MVLKIRLDGQDEYRLMDLQKYGYVDLVSDSVMSTCYERAGQWKKPTATPFPILEFGRGHSFCLDQRIFARLHRDRTHVLHPSVVPSPSRF